MMLESSKSKQEKGKKKFQWRFKAIDILMAGDLVSHLSEKCQKPPSFKIVRFSWGPWFLPQVC